MEREVPNRRNDVNDFKDYDQEDGELHDLPTFSATNEFASNSEQVENNIDIAEEKEEVPIKDVEMDENHDIDHSVSLYKGLEFKTYAFGISYLAAIDVETYAFGISYLAAIDVKVCGVMLGQSLAIGKHFKSGLVRYHAKDDDGIFVIMDVSRGSRLRAWLRAKTQAFGKKHEN
nr:hypothetical protein [Tanacetum cinerariifolium]